MFSVLINTNLVFYWIMYLEKFVDSNSLKEIFHIKLESDLQQNVS